jgi:hypothetical protein
MKFPTVGRERRLLALIAIVAIIALLLLGGEVSKILSTVGKSVGRPKSKTPVACLAWRQGSTTKA